MPFQIIRNDITKVKATVIVNTANPRPVIGGGTDSAIYKAAGEKELLAERKKIGDIAPGQAVATPAFNLPAKHIIHTVGPAWVDGNHGECDILRFCYFNSLTLAAKLKAKSIAFPLISTGVYGFPKDEALDIATTEIGKFLLTHEMEIILVVFDKKAFEISGQQFGQIKAYIDEHGVGLAKEAEYGDELDDRTQLERARRLQQIGLSDSELDITLSECTVVNKEESIAKKHAKRVERKESPRLPGMTLHEIDIESMLDETEEMFSPALLRLIDEKGFKKDSDCYHKANVNRRFFSKIRSDPYYRPKKQTVCAFALALELSLSETKELLEKAGYSLSRSWKFDLVIECCIKNHFYDVNKINIMLFDMNLPQLGSGGSD